MWQGVQRERGEINGFRDPSHRHAQVCPEKKGVPGQLSPSSKWYRTLSMPREALTTTSPLSEIRCRPSSNRQDFEDICLPPSARVPYYLSLPPSDEFINRKVCSSALDSQVSMSTGLFVSARMKGNRHLVINFWPQSKLPATLLFTIKWSSDSRGGGPFRCRAPKSTTAQLRQHSQVWLYPFVLLSSS